MSGERLTEELLEQLLSSASPEAYLAEAEIEERELAQYLNDLLQEKGLTKSEVIKASGANPTHIYQVFQGTRYLGRDNAIKIAFGLRCNLREAQRLLRIAGCSELWVKTRRDAIINCAVKPLSSDMGI